ncbi:restriction endonuclease subunit S [Brevundimonas sp.]|uniref:restriction endonuclease subunit S n=1 Tax=Brevundimonas sp. TaxID=1871086 RepID=UPI0028AE7BE0|nr:restriction endonuclease subunit S [Brevundimonas sp.]
MRLIDCVHKTPAAQPDGFPYVGIPQMKDGVVDFSDARRISAEDYAEWTRKAKPQLHDVVLSRRTNPGVTATFGENVEFALGQNLVLLRADGTNVEPPFLRWLASSPHWWVEIDRFRNVGAVFDSLKCADVPKFQLPIPPKPEQRSISGLLGALQEKIELNRRMNETLEAMAQAIFRDWFADFGPVRRKIEGATDPVAIMGGLTPDPARAAELAGLFPAALGENGLPKGWAERPIGDQVEIAGGSTPSTADESLWAPAEHRWATPKDLSGMADLALFETGRRISSAGLAKITSGLLPTGTVLLSSRAPIGYLAIAQEPVAINQGFIALKPTADLGSAYLYLWCKANMEAILANANGSTFMEISKKNFRPITSAVPDDGVVVRAFGDIAQPLIDRIVAAARENRTLAETRNYLLPRLMSGAVRVGDAQSQDAAA